VESNGTTLDPLGDLYSYNKGYGPQFGETACISELNRAKKVKFDALV